MRAEVVPPPSAPRAGTGPHRWAGGVSRFKRVVGGGLRSRTGRRRATEAAIAVGAPKRMLDLERPEYVRTA